MENQGSPKLSNGQTREQLIARLPHPGPGRPKETEEKKIQKKVIKQLVEEYRQALANALPDISPILISKSLTGDVPAIKELNDRVMGKAPQSTDYTSGGKPIKFAWIQEDDEDNNSIQTSELGEETT